jgi:hypothetical protein
MAIIGPTSFSFQGIDWKKIGMGALAVMVGALLTYITKWISGVDFGAYTPIVTVIWSFVAHVVGAWVSDNQ